MTKPPWFDDPACVRHKPAAVPVDYRAQSTADPFAGLDPAEVAKVQAAMYAKDPAEYEAMFTEGIAGAA